MARVGEQRQNPPEAGRRVLIRAGKLDNAAGFVFGTDVNLKNLTVPEEPESTLSMEEVLDELIAPLGSPRSRTSRSATASTWRRCRWGPG